MTRTALFYFSILYATIFFCNVVFVQSSSATRIPRNGRTETDRLALLSIKAKLSNSPSYVLSSWNDSLSFCNWEGVTCSPRRERVVTLNLMSQGLDGSLSPYIGNLTFLRSLNLMNNSIKGEIPPDIGHLPRLRELSLMNNSFVGEIPVNISRCANLQGLHLGFNMLVGKIPSEFGTLSKLVSLTLDRNNLTGAIPTSIGNLSSLEVLSLFTNNLHGSIPVSLGELNSLKWFSLGENMLTGKVPPLVYNISSLSDFTVTMNQLNGILPPLISLPNLESFEIGANQISGSLPVSLFNASGLQRIDVSENNIRGRVPVEVGNLEFLQIFNFYANSFGSGDIHDLDFVPSLTNCTSLWMLDISSNHFGGMLPNSIANLSDQLSYLYIGTNQIHGVIPSGLLNFVNLISLGMENNFFSGGIPYNLGMLQNLQSLHLDGNRLSGQLPPTLGNMSNLFLLDLSNNTFEGKIISEIKNCKSLQILSLLDNKFNGSIPGELFDFFSQLRYLDLGRNSFTGTLPNQLGSFKNLEELYVNENKLSGQIPSTIGGCFRLRYLSLRGNFFYGPIPSSFKLLKEIVGLDLSKNNLSGPIPEDLGSLPSLQKLNLSSNNLEGAIPRKGVFKNRTAFSVLENNKLCGGIPELHLPACRINTLKRRKVSAALKVTLGVVISLVFLALLLVVILYYRMRPKEKPSIEPSEEANFTRVSYHELYQTTNGFSLTNLIGVGSFGSVYKGMLNEEEGLIAIKVLKLIERGASKSFVTECNAFRNIRHRNLLKILTICSSVDFKGNDFKALVFKFMPNGSLDDCLHQSQKERPLTKALSLLERLNIAIDVASALDYLHNQCETPIVHCDLKPNNILLDEELTAYVGDFGLAKFLIKHTSNFNTSESTASARGTIGYIPPEYGIGAEVSTKGDMFSYGIILLEMLTGKRPTSDIFKDGPNLHEFASMALPLGVMDIVDQKMLSEDDHSEVINDSEDDHSEVINNSVNQKCIDNRIEECIMSIFRIGVACSVGSPGERLEIHDALMELHVVREAFLGLGRTSEKKASSSQMEVDD